MAQLTWEEYGRSIVEGLADLKSDARESKVELAKLVIAVSLLKERSESVAKFEARLSELETKVEAAEDRVDTYRRSLAAVGLTLLGVILLPIARAYFTTKGGG